MTTGNEPDPHGYDLSHETAGWLANFIAACSRFTADAARLVDALTGRAHPPRRTVWDAIREAQASGEPAGHECPRWRPDGPDHCGLCGRSYVHGEERS